MLQAKGLLIITPDVIKYNKTQINNYIYPWKVIHQQDICMVIDSSKKIAT